MSLLSSLIIRQENKEDHQTVFGIQEQAFGREEEALLVNRLRTGHAFIPDLSLVAELEGKPVGHILFTKIRIKGPEGDETPALALAPLAVLPGWQKQGIGGALIRTGLENAAAAGYNAVIVLGHEDYYPGFGFVPAVKWGIRAPFEVPSGFFMALELFPGALDNAAGVVVYAPEFEIG